MLILPAIDLRGGQCVRLQQGDYDRETVFDEDPVAVARRFEDAGARWLHLVDLDGAREGEPRNLDPVTRVVQAVRIHVELGGGIRTTETVRQMLDLGVARVVVGTRAVREPGWLAEIARSFPGRVALGLDARESRVAVAGWQEVTEKTVIEQLEQIEGLPLSAVVYTDVSRDGMMEGPNFAALKLVAAATSLPVIASGGVTTVENVKRLAATGVIHGAVIGRAIYEGTLTVEDAIAAAGEQTGTTN